MKYSEFKQVVEELGYTFFENKYEVRILDKGACKLIIIDKTDTHVIDPNNVSYITLSHKDKTELLDLACELAKTPLAEREEEKRYYLRNASPLLGGNGYNRIRENKGDGMTKSLKESQSFDIVSGKEFGRETAVHSLDTLAEDNAFMKRMETIPFKNMNKEELQKIYKIALRGLKTRSALDRAIAKLRVHEHEKKQSGTINNGLKYHEIFKRGREMLMQIREG